MDLVCTPNLGSLLSSANLLLDTCVVIEASKYIEIDEYLNRLSADGCSFLTIPSVKEEFISNTKNDKEFEELSKYFDSLQITFLPNTEKRLMDKKEGDFYIALNRCNRRINPSHVDRMLLAIPYLYRRSSEDIYLMTLNHKDVPRELYERIGFISYDVGEFRNIGVYRFKVDKFEHMVRNAED